MIVYFNGIKEKLCANKKWISAIYMLTVLFCCNLTLQPLSEQISISIRLVFYFLCIFSIMTMDFARDKVKNVFDKIWKKILQIVLEIYGTFAIVGMYCLYNGITRETRYSNVFYFVLAFFWIHPIMQGLIALLIKMGESLSVAEHEVRLRTRLILIGGVLFPCMLFLAAFNPAITSRDSYYCFYMAHQLWQPDVFLEDWHPPFYIFVLHLLLRICDSISFLIIVQCIYFALIFVDGILFLYQCGFSKKILGVFYIFITCGISNLIQLVTLWKDIPYMVSLMWLTILLMKLCMQREKYENKKEWYIQFVFAVIMTAFFRQNGILPALAVIILLPVVMRFTRKTVFAGIICLLLMAAVKGPLYHSMNVEPQPQLKFFSLANDIMYSYYMGLDVSDDAMIMINVITGNDPDNYFESRYSPYWVDYNDREPSGYSVVEFMKIYAESAIRHPKMAVMAALTRNCVIWSIMSPAGEHRTCVNHLGEDRSEDLQSNLYPCRVDNILTYKLKPLCNWITGISILYPIYWRTGIYNLLIIFMTVIALCSQQKRKLMYLIPYVPILGNLAALAIASGWSDYRYFWPSMTISLFLLFYFLFNRKTKVEESLQK